jgi:hypothetical protein
MALAAPAPSAELPGAKHHEAHDAPSIELFPIFLDPDFCPVFVVVGCANEHCRRAGVQA